MTAYFVEVLDLPTGVEGSAPGGIMVFEVLVAGPPGASGDATFDRFAGETISALRVVYELDGEVFDLDSQDAEHIQLLAGIAVSAAVTGGSVQIKRTGVISDSSWSWTPGPVWLGADGALTQVPPSAGFDVVIGSAVSPTRLVLNIQEPISLE